jgi:hypothetical protein
MGGFRLVDTQTHQEYAFRSVQLAWLLKEKLITLPHISDGQINDKSDADWIVKTLACSQSAWFLVNSIARLAHHLPLTTLELEVLPFIATTWWTYFFWWDKPVNILLPTEVHVHHLAPSVLERLASSTSFPHPSAPWWRPGPKETHERGWDFYWFEKPLDLELGQIKPSRSSSSQSRTSTPVPTHLQHAFQNTTAASRISAWYRPAINEMHPSEWTFADDFTIYILGMFINGVLLTAWSFSFPTQIESILWRVSVLTMLGSITLWWPIARLASLFLGSGSVAKHAPFYLIIAVYMVCRAYVIVEPFVGMRALPAAAYRTVTWSEYFAHIG